ncbi:MAG: hypothetical protein LBI82_00870 [Dysgonamonadaceae bacterium]|jgi:hypothetical protein|nr:hypothetical protein [Dysgonamonadaceae bacterium]
MVLYNTTGNPTTADEKAISDDFDSDLEIFTKVIEGLDCNTTYFFRAYAINGKGTSYSDVDEFFKTSPCPVFNVTLNAGNGTVSQNTFNEVTSIDLSDYDAVPSCASWTFVGWVEDAAVTSTTDKPDFISNPYIPTKDVELFAVYKTGGKNITETLTQTAIAALTNTTAYGSQDIISTSGIWTGGFIKNVISGVALLQLRQASGGASPQPASYVESPVFPGAVSQVKIQTYQYNQSAPNNTAIGRKFLLMSTEYTDRTASVSDYGDGSTLELNGLVTINVTDEPTSFKIYTNGAAGVSSIDVTYILGTVTYNTNPFCEFIIPAGVTRKIQDYEGGNIIFEDDGTGVGQLDLEGTTSFAVPAGAFVKLEKTVVANRWYAIGFPFEVAQVYLNETYPNLEAYHPSTGGHFWLKTITPDETAKFEYVQDIEKDRGYIFQVPQALVDVNEVVTFISGENTILYNIEDLDVNEIEIEAEKFGMIVNPSVADIILPCVEGEDLTNHFYIFDEDKNFTHHHGREKTLKPFESLVVFTNPNGQPVPSSFNVETGPTGLFKISADKGKIVDVRYYNLQGLEISQPVENNIYIVKTTYESNAVETTKTLFKK